MYNRKFILLFIFSPLNRGHKKTVSIMYETVLVRVACELVLWGEHFLWGNLSKFLLAYFWKYPCALCSTEIHWWLHSVVLSNRKWVPPKAPSSEERPLVSMMWRTFQDPSATGWLCLLSCLFAWWRTPVAKRRLCLLYIKPMLFRLCSSNLNCSRAWLTFFTS